MRWVALLGLAACRFGFDEEVEPHRRMLVVAGAAEELPDFPLLVALDPDRIDYAATRPDGADVAFFLGGTPLVHEIERWEPGGRSLLWVAVPTVAAAPATTVIEMRYGAGLREPGVPWNADYAAVWHLDDDPTPGNPIRDATANATDGAGQASMTSANQVDGVIGGALELDGIDDFVAVVDSPALRLRDADSRTLEAWVRPRSFASIGNVFRYDDCDNADGEIACMHPLYCMRLELDGRINAFYGPTGGLSGVTSPAPGLVVDIWHHLALVRDAAARTTTLYIDGQLVRSQPDSTTGTWETDGQFLMLGRFETGNAKEYFTGTLDEARVSTVARSAAWIETQHRSMQDTLIEYSNADL